MLEKKWEYNVSCLDFKKAYDSLRREVLYTIISEFCIPLNLVGIIKMYLNETCNKVCIDKHLYDAFSVQNGLADRKRCFIHHCFSAFL
jgi:hypothetical protein